MDQVRVALKWLKDQHFWVLTVIASLVAVGCWYMAASELAKEFKANQSKIDSEFSAQQNRERMPFHPNEVVNQQQRKEIEQLALEVEQVWSRRYQRQREVVLKWPAQLDKGIKEGSSDSFLRHVSKKRFDDFITDRFRDRYLNYIQKRFPDLPKIINALEIDDNAQGGMGMGSRGFGGMMEGDFSPAVDENGDLIEEQEFLVLWEDQMMVKQQLAWSQRPSSRKIWVTQEDLWVYETLLRSIAATNTAAGADRYSNAAVRNIYQLQVGRQAAQDLRTQSRIFRPSSDSGGLGGEMGMGMGGEMDMGMDMGMGMEGEMGMGMDMGMEMGMGMGMDGEMGMGMGGGLGGGEADQTLLMGRYIDANQKPIPAPAPGAPLDFGQEYKRLPVRLTLKMDQRWLPRLIVEMANAPLQIEVHEVRINPSSADGMSGGTGMGMGGGGMRGTRLRALELAGRSGGSGGGGSFMEGGGGGFGGMGGEVSAFDREPQIADVIVRGTVYIFNPPDPTALAVGAEDSMDF